MNAIDQPEIKSSEQCLSFRVGHALFAINIRHIKEIIVFGKLDKAPATTHFLAGFITRHGIEVPVLDLAIRLHCRPTWVGRRTSIVIIEMPLGNDRRAIGLMVDEVFAVVDLPPGEIGPPPVGETQPAAPADVVFGNVGVAGKIVTVLDPTKLVEAEDLAAIAAMSA